MKNLLKIWVKKCKTVIFAWGFFKKTKPKTQFYSYLNPRKYWKCLHHLANLHLLKVQFFKCLWSHSGHYYFRQSLYGSSCVIVRFDKYCIFNHNLDINISGHFCPDISVWCIYYCPHCDNVYINFRTLWRHKENVLRLTKWNVNVPFVIKGPRKVTPYKLRSGDGEIVQGSTLFGKVNFCFIFNISSNQMQTSYDLLQYD